MSRRNFIKAGPLVHADAAAYLAEHYEMSTTEAETLISVACASVSGMASRFIASGRRVWVSQLTTQDGKFIIEEE